MDEQQNGSRGSAPSANQATVGDTINALLQAGLAGANWFFWIAGLSLVNTAIAHSGGDRHFIVGLSITAIVDAIAVEIGKQNPDSVQAATIMAVGFSLFVALVVAIFGWLSRKRIIALFGLGMGLYAIDGVIYAVLGDFMSAAFHGYALYSMFQGFKAFRVLGTLEAELTNGDEDVFEPEPGNERADTEK